MRAVGSGEEEGLDLIGRVIAHVKEPSVIFETTAGKRLILPLKDIEYVVGG
jgi:hypothetical protein